MSGEIFIVGARRSGTHWLHRIVTAHPDVASVPSETYLISNGIAPLLERFHHGVPGSEQVGSVFIERERLIEAARTFCDTVFDTFRGGRRLIAERTPWHVYHLPLIVEMYPGCRIVHIIRDGRDVTQSLLTQPWGPTTLAAAANEWRDSVSAGTEAGLPPERYREVRYERLHADPEQEVPALYEWLGVTIEKAALADALTEARRVVNRGRSRSPVGSGGWRQAWGSRQVEDFERIAGPLQRKLGYESEDRRPVVAEDRRRSIRRPEPPPGRGFLRRRSRSGERPKATIDGSQRLVDQLVGRLRPSRAGSLDQLLTADATVRVRRPEGQERAVGPEAAELLRRTVASEPMLEGGPSQGESWPGVPWSGALLRYGNGDPTSNNPELVVFLRASGNRVEELVLHLR